jgi:hypothetical protein
LDPAVFPAIKKFVQSSKHVQSIPAYEQSYIFEVLFHLLDFTSFGWDIVAFGVKQFEMLQTVQMLVIDENLVR